MAERINRSEMVANLSLVPTTSKPQWMNPAPVRTKKPKPLGMVPWILLGAVLCCAWLILGYYLDWPIPTNFQ